MKRKELIFRVFISSTFSDFIAERNALQEIVFPKLRAFCEARNARFQPVDLRWGVSSEASLDQQTMSICLDELARCQEVSPKPNFIILLGERYGWIPLRVRIPGTEFVDILSVLSASEKELLCSERNVSPWRNSNEKRVGWYRKDNNAIPPEYVLQPRVLDEVNCEEDAQRESLRKTEREDWAKIESEIHVVIAKAINILGWDEVKRAPYEQSATHQEINAGALTVKNTERHVLAYFRTITVDKVDGQTGTPIGDFVDQDPQTVKRLMSLKDQVSKRIPGNVCNLSSRWDAEADRMGDAQNTKGQPCGHLKYFCEKVEADLTSIIQAEIDAYSELPAIDRERYAHRDFGTQRSAVFEGFGEILSRISVYLNDASVQVPLVLYGPSGCGKSAIMARAIANVGGYGASSDVAQDQTLVYRFVGATPASTDLHRLLGSLCKELHVKEIPLDLNERIACFQKVLHDARGNHAQTVVFIDALDQLEPADKASMLRWIPETLGAGVKLVISVLQSENGFGEVFRTARHRWPNAGVRVDGLQRVFAESALETWLRQVGRCITTEQKDVLLQQYEKTKSPLYLKIAFERVRLLRHLDRVPVLANSVDGLLSDMIGSLEEERHHGRVLVERVLSSIAASKNGLSEDELLDLLSADADVMAVFRRRNPESPAVERLPGVIWSRLFADLKPYMIRRSVDGLIVLGFFHRHVGEAVSVRYSPSGCIRYAHGALREYYVTLWKNRASDTTKLAGRAAKGLAYHAWRSLPHASEELGQMLLEPRLFEAWVNCGYVHELSQDLRLSPDNGVHSLLRQFLETWRNETLWICLFPKLVCQTLFNALGDIQGAIPLSGMLSNHLQKSSSGEMGFCMKARRGLSKEFFTFSLSGPSLGETPFDPDHLFFESGSSLGVYTLSLQEPSCFDIYAQSASLITCSTENKYFALGYRVRRPRWIVYDRTGRRVVDASCFPATSDIEPLALSFLGQDRLLVISQRSVQVINLPDGSCDFEQLWDSDQLVLQSVVSMCPDGWLVATVARLGREYTVRLLKVSHDDEALLWCVSLCSEQRLDRRVSHLVCNQQFVGAVSVDGVLHVLWASREGSRRNERYPLPKRVIRAFSADEKAVYFGELDDLSVFRLTLDDGVLSVSPPFNSAPVMTHPHAESVYVLVGNAKELTRIEKNSFLPERPILQNSQDQVILPEPVRCIRSSPSTTLHVLLGSTPTAGILDDRGDLLWVTPSHSSLLDGSILDSGAFILLDAERSVYMGTYPSPDTRMIISAAGCERVFALPNGIAALRTMSSDLTEIIFYCYTGETIGLWSNRHLVDNPCDCFLGADVSDRGDLSILFKTDPRITKAPCLRRIELDSQGVVVSDNTWPRKEASGWAKLRRSCFVERKGHAASVIDLDENTPDIVCECDPRVGDFSEVELIGTPSQRLIVFYGENGIFLSDYPAMKKHYILPACSGMDKIVLLKDSRLCRSRTLQTREFYSLT